MPAAKLFSDAQRRLAVAVANLSYCNPFLPERITHEREVLGDAFGESDQAWHKHPEESAHRSNLERLMKTAEQIADQARIKLAAGLAPAAEEAALYEDAVFYFLYNKYQRAFYEIIGAFESGGQPGPQIALVYDDFRADMRRYFQFPHLNFPGLEETGHLFAMFFQLRRAFHHIFDNIIGGSMAAARLRAAAWQSIFTWDMRRYRRGLYLRMDDITTLVWGPSGTGKELVGRAIGLSRYIPFDEKRKVFRGDPRTGFFTLNLSALSPTLIESELFGHTKGSFTGAVRDRPGYFELCPPHGTVFLDEIGDLDPAIQVKLLRVVQSRTFQRIGEANDRRFQGKVVAATNRNLEAEMTANRFRQDLYYRMCSDVIRTPSLSELLEDSPEQLRNLLLFICRRVAGDNEANALSAEVREWIADHLGTNYPWPGNVRELEQCVRNIVVRRNYQPRPPDVRTAIDGVTQSFLQAELTADELISQYCTWVYYQCGNYQQAASRLGIDRRTVKARIDRKLLERFRHVS